MASSLAWLDYSERDRRNAMRVLDLFRDTGTLDELGLASIRDSYADLFFPGTSTVQTRACYFLIVPWTFKRLEKKGISSGMARNWAREQELRLNERLRGSDGDAWGVFGRRSGRTLKRLPSEVYWGGLGSWGIRMFPGHKWAYFRSLEHFYRRLARFRAAPRGAESGRASPANWHHGLPDAPPDFPDNVGVELRGRDARYLRERIRHHHPRSLLAVLANRRDDRDLDEKWPWQLANRRELEGSELSDRLRDAERFAVCLHGAALLYNLMLAEQTENSDWEEHYLGRLDGWAADVRALGPSFGDWKLDGVWRVVRSQNRKLSYPTRAFIEGWIGFLQQSEPQSIVARDSRARDLVRTREGRLKGARARLMNQRRRELWNGESGTARMSYRWESARRILRDIFDGLKAGGDDARDA